MDPKYPFRLLDRTGRSLVWVKINDQRAHTNRDFHFSDACFIEVCPRIDGAGSRQDLMLPCFKYGADGFFRLKQPMHQWLVEHLVGQPGYQLELRYANDEYDPAWHVGFRSEDRDIAALFKLTWGGQ